MKKCKFCGNKIIAPSSRFQEYCTSCWKSNKDDKIDSTYSQIKLLQEVPMEKKKTKTQIKEEHADSIINFLKEKEVAEEDMTKIFSCAYNKIKKAK